jgi:hypothetical protein
MVVIYRPCVSEGYEWVVPVGDDGVEVVRQLGEARAEDWQPVRVRILRRLDDGTPLRAATLPWYGNHVMILTGEAVEAIGERLAEAGDLLRLDCDEAELWLLHVRRFVDCLDEDRSTIVRFQDGRIMRLTTPVFDPERVGNAELFKIPQMPRGSLYLVGGLVDVIRDAGLAGTAFEAVWSDHDQGSRRRDVL